VQDLLLQVSWGRKPGPWRLPPLTLGTRGCENETGPWRAPTPSQPPNGAPGTDQAPTAARGSKREWSTHPKRRNGARRILHTHDATRPGTGGPTTPQQRPIRMQKTGPVPRGQTGSVVSATHPRRTERARGSATPRKGPDLAHFTGHALTAAKSNAKDRPPTHGARRGQEIGQAAAAGRRNGGERSRHEGAQTWSRTPITPLRRP